MGQPANARYGVNAARDFYRSVKKMKLVLKRYRFAILTVMACAFLLLAYFNLKIDRLPEGLVLLAGSIMLMVQAVGALICRKIEDNHLKTNTMEPDK
jgi:hypothetical protein